MAVSKLSLKIAIFRDFHKNYNRRAMKKIIVSLFTLFIFSSAFALPGFKPFIPDSSGEYVFYRDNSFERESYVGLLCYDETTYEIKYYSPKNAEKSEPEKNIALLIKVNPDSSFFDMLGERIISTIDYNSDDVNILNYLHDFLYEISAKRIQKGAIETREDFQTQDFDLFGGKVTLVYDCIIPMFNLRSILDEKGNKILDCCTIGQISSSSDTSFENFKGIKAIPLNSKAKSTSKTKKAKTQKFSFNNQHITLDKNWTQNMENVWTYGDSAIVTMSEIPLLSDDKTLNDFYILRKLTESTQGRYIDFSNTEILFNAKNRQYKITSISHDVDEKNTIRTIKLISPSDEKFNYCSVSVFSNIYNENSAYFDKILNQYKIK